MSTQTTQMIRTSRVCPCYRLPQIVPNGGRSRGARLPICAAVEEATPIPLGQAASLCRSGDFPICPRFRSANPDWQPDAVVQLASVKVDVRRQLLNSAAWILGIPLGITLVIIMAIWVTENIWMPTQSIISTPFY